MKPFKYNTEIDRAIAAGASLPKLLLPNDKEAYRFVFSKFPERNHLPVCITNPKRVLPPAIRTSGFALSCFGVEEKALQRYSALKKSYRLISKTIGDSITFGIITNRDGMITEEDDSTSHFDFYEFESCSPSAIFTFKTVLP